MSCRFISATCSWFFVSAVRRSRHAFTASLSALRSWLIIGSAAGVVVMSLEKITFGWYMKHISWIAFVGYIAGIVCYWLIRTFLYAI